MQYQNRLFYYNQKVIQNYDQLLLLNFPGNIFPFLLATLPSSQQ